MKGENMRIVEHKVLLFDELSDDAKERARQWFRDGIEGGGSWASEWREAAEEASKFLPFEITNWSIGDRGQFVEIRVKDENIEDMSGVRLWKWLQANNGFNLGVDPSESCPFTGYFGDESLLDPIRAFLKRPNASTTGRELFQACADSWADAWSNDIDYQFSDESIDENIRANEYEFYENGERA